MTKAPINRIKQYIHAPQPASPHAPALVFGNVVQMALQTMCGLMGSIDSELAFKAASAILELEKARLRHKIPLAGVHQTQPGEQAEVLEEQITVPTLTAEQTADEQPPMELTQEQEELLEEAVEEIKVVLNQKQAEDGLPLFSRDVLWGQYANKVKELGFDEFLRWHRLIAGRSNPASAVPPPRSNQKQSLEVR